MKDAKVKAFVVWGLAIESAMRSSLDQGEELIDRACDYGRDVGIGRNELESVVEWINMEAVIRDIPTQ